ncbi:hypothetical protein [Candidatus Hecatella orcuttiae]|uniref:hypothetical protein n=1 Tax=Candidatus Hecatella orcuttiae TaxID=1935119 RepID=UPI002867CDD3|nr:hypothetical protein [Candidatus Hecatella orcuttiae]
MAERYLKAVQKVLNKGSVYLRLHGSIYKIRSLEIKGSDAKFDCRSLHNGENYEISFKIEKKLMTDLIGFGLRDKPNSVFVISEDADKPIWFETSLQELIEEVEKRALRKDLLKELSTYADIEET